MAYTKYTKEILEQHVPHVTSFAGLARRLNITPTGSNTINLSHRCKSYGVDTSHFTGSAHRRGKKARNRLSSKEILVLGTKSEGRKKAELLRRALLEEDVQYVCTKCDNNGLWNDEPLSLQIDHRNGKFWDNRKTNLRFLCPNCHTQTTTWGSKKRSCGGTADTHR